MRANATKGAAAAAIGSFGSGPAKRNLIPTNNGPDCEKFSPQPVEETGDTTNTVVFTNIETTFLQNLCPKVSVGGATWGWANPNACCGRTI